MLMQEHRFIARACAHGTRAAECSNPWEQDTAQAT